MPDMRRGIAKARAGPEAERLVYGNGTAHIEARVDQHSAGGTLLDLRQRGAYQRTTYALSAEGRVNKELMKFHHPFAEWAEAEATRRQASGTGDEGHGIRCAELRGQLSAAFFGLKESPHICRRDAMRRRSVDIPLRELAAEPCQGFKILGAARRQN